MIPAVTEVAEGVALALHVQPRASQNEIVGLQGDEIKLRLTSPPVEGAANRLCCAFLAKLFGVSKSEVSLLSGDRSRHKRLLVRGVDAATACRVLGLD